LRRKVTGSFRIFIVPTIVWALTLDSAQAGIAVENASKYKIQDLGELPQIADDVTVTVNRGGSVAFCSSTERSVRATVWERGNAAPIEGVPGYPNSIAHAINRRGDIAGWMNTSENPVDSLSTVQGFIRHGKRTRLVAGLGGRNSRVLGLSDQGAVVGTADLSSGTRHAFLYSEGAMLDLGTLHGPPSAASGINNLGEVVGVSNHHAFLWRHGRMTDLGLLMPRDSNWVLLDAFSINDRGQIACSARHRGQPAHLLLLTPT
jgi:probable HAF family extracellular repeat protein